MSSTVNYTIEKVNPKDVISGYSEVSQFVREIAPDVSAAMGGNFNFSCFNLRKYAQFGRITVCKKNGTIVGIMLARGIRSVFDDETNILMQDLLWVKPGALRAARLLFLDFLDFGKRNADHVITMIHSKTNIKGKTLEKLGFRKLEELYRIEV